MGMSSSIAAIHVAKKQLGLDDETYRAKLTVITGKPSVKDMSEDERQKVLTVFRSEGFKPAVARRPDGRQKLSGRYAAKLQALWIAGWNLGVFKNRDDAALEAFIKRQTGLDAVRFCRDPQDAEKAIEAMKAWMAREGGVEWRADPFRPDWKKVDGYRIAVAQWALLYQAKVGFEEWLNERFARDPEQEPLSNGEWIKVMNQLGSEVRKREKAGAR
jgi:hypothetical protein